MTDFHILNSRELEALASSSDDDVDMAAVRCVVREVRELRAALAKERNEHAMSTAEFDPLAKGSNASGLFLLIKDLAAEIRERRSHDLTVEEREALGVLLADIKRAHARAPDPMYPPPHGDAIPVLDRLLARANGGGK